jgi:hypothetical protein
VHSGAPADATQMRACDTRPKPLHICLIELVVALRGCS